MGEVNGFSKDHGVSIHRISVGTLASAPRDDGLEFFAWPFLSRPNENGFHPGILKRRFLGKVQAVLQRLFPTRLLPCNVGSD